LKRIRAFGLAVFTALALTAVVGVAGASATFDGIWVENGYLNAEATPITIAAQQTATGKPKFGFNGGQEAKCETSKFHDNGPITYKLTSLSLAGGLSGEGAYDGCSGLGFSTAGIQMNGCTYRVYVAFPTMDIECPAGKAIEIAVWKGVTGKRYCTIMIPAQKGLANVTLTNNGYHSTITDTMAIGGLRYRFEKGEGISCTPGEWTDGTYSNTILLEGFH
jgi:hypothetical protein